MKTLLLFIVGIIPFVIFAQDGSLDVSFGNNGMVVADITGFDDNATGLAEAPDGRILVGNVANNMQTGDYAWGISAFTPEGNVDNSFDNDGYLELPNSTIYGFSIVVQSDGKILYESRGSGGYKITRLLTDGSVDTSFGQGGEIITFDQTALFHELILNEDDSFFCFANIQPAGYIVRVKKFLSDGTIDNSYGISGSRDFALEANSEEPIAHIVNNGELLVKYSVINSSNPKHRIAHYFEDGTLDTSFGTNGIAYISVEDDWLCRISPLLNGKILVSASYYGQNNLERKIIKLDAFGNLDSSFANNGYLEGYTVAAVQNNQSIIADNSLVDFEGGTILNYKRFFSNGTLDTSFNFQYSYSEISEVHFIFTQVGKILIASSDIWYNSPTDLVLFRYNNDALETSEFSENNLSLYPNPSSGIFTLSYSNYAQDDFYHIVDVAGKTVNAGKLIDGQNQIDISATAAGLYFLKIGKKVIKLVKE